MPQKELRPQEFIDHDVPEHPLFHRLWKSIDLWNDRLVPDKAVLEGIDKAALGSELGSQHRSVIESGPGYRPVNEYTWDHILGFVSGDEDGPPSLAFGMDDKWFRAHVQNAELAIRMADIIENANAGVPDQDRLCESIRATAGLTMAYAMAGMSEYLSALDFLEHTYQFIGGANRPQVRQAHAGIRGASEDSDRAHNWHVHSFYQTHGIGQRGGVLAFYDKLKDASARFPSFIQPGYQGEPGSYSRSLADAVSSEDYELAAKIHKRMDADIALPLRENTGDIQIYTAAKMLAAHIMFQIPQISKNDDTVVLSTADTQLMVSREQNLKIVCAARYKPMVMSTLNNDRYSHVFPRFDWSLWLY